MGTMREGQQLGPEPARVPSAGCKILQRVTSLEVPKTRDAERSFERRHEEKDSPAGTIYPNSTLHEK